MRRSLAVVSTSASVASSGTDNTGLEKPNRLSVATVTFSVTADGSSLARTSVVTGAHGHLSVPPWTIGLAAGSNTVAAAVSPSVAATWSVTERLRWIPA